MELRDKEDLALVRKVQKEGDRASFDKLYEKYKRVILSYLLRILNNDKELAEELMHETFLKAYLNIRRFKPDAKFFSWLYTIARNVAFSRMKKRGIKTVSIETDISGDGSIVLGDTIESRDSDINEIIKNKELKERIGKALALMPLKYREVLILCVVQELTYEEAAKVLKCTVTNISTMLNRARKYFSELLREDESR